MQCVGVLSRAREKIIGFRLYLPEATAVFQGRRVMQCGVPCLLSRLGGGRILRRLCL